MRPPFLAAVFALSACVHETPEQPFTLRPLEVDPEVEASEVTRALERAGFTVRVRVTGRGFVALSAELGSNQATTVRVITKLGTVVGLDAPDHANPWRRRITLVPELSGRDLDGDGHPELLVELTDEALGRCIGVTRVLTDGRVIEVPLPTAEFGADACAEDARDVLGDARPELLVRYRGPREAGGRFPTVHVPFVGEHGRWSEADRSLTRAFYENERARIEALLRAAQREEDTAEASALERERELVDVLLARRAPAPETETETETETE